MEEENNGITFVRWYQSEWMETFNVTMGYNRIHVMCFVYPIGGYSMYLDGLNNGICDLF